MAKLLNPLEGAAPTLRPTSQPIDTGFGATPPSQRSPSAELARAFEGFNGELVSTLRDVAAQQENDAEQLGMAKASEISSAEGMAAAEGKMKKMVDAGVIPAVRAPAFERGFRTRYGMSAADTLSTSLLTRMNEATRTGNRVDPAQIIAEEKQKILSTISPQDTYAHIGFAHAATAVEQNFRARAAEEYASNYKKDAEVLAANAGGALVTKLAAAPADLQDTVKSAILGHLEDRRKELPVSEVNSNFVTQAIRPSFYDLLSQNRFEEARNVLKLSDLDVTGKGGLLGQTQENKIAFAEMRNRLEAEEKTAKARSLDEHDKLYTVADKDANNDAMNVIEATRKADPNGAVLFSDIERRTNDYAATLTNDPLKARKTSMFRKTLQSEWTNEGQINQERYAYEVDDLLAGAVSLKDTDLTATEARLNHYKDINAIAPSKYASGLNQIKQLRNLYGVYDDNDVKTVLKSLYTNISLGSSIGAPVTHGIAFGDNDKELGKAWDKLNTAQQTEHQTAVIDNINDTLRSKLRKYDNVMLAKQDIPKLLSEVQNSAAKFATDHLNEMVGNKKKADDQVKVNAQAAAITSAAPANLILSSPSTSGAYDMSYTQKVKMGRGNTTQDWTQDYVAPDGKSSSLREQAALPPSERDATLLPVHYSSILTRLGHPSVTVVDLPALAAEANATEGNAGARRKASDLYGYVKSAILGFTPDEITKGETKHGMKFTASEIDPKRTRVFRTRAELTTNYNGGEPTELFTKVGNAVNASNLTPQQFYLAQLALLPK